MPLASDLSQVWSPAPGRRSSSATGRRIGVTAALLLPNVLLTLLNMADPANAWLAFGWIVAATCVIGLTFGVRQVAHPSVLTFGLGVLPSSLGLAVVQFSSYGPPQDQVYRLTWASLGIFVLVTTLVARPRAELASDSRWLARLGVLSLAGMAVASGIFFSSHGIPLLAFNAEQVRVDASAGSGVVLAVIHIGGVITAIALVVAVRSAARWTSIATMALVGVALVLPALTGTRSAVLNALIAALAAALATRRWRHAWIRIGAILAVGVIVAWVLGDIRYSGTQTTMQDIVVQRLAADPYSAGLILSTHFEDARVVGWGIVRTAFATFLPGSQPLVGDVLKQQLNLQFAGGAVAFPVSAEGYLLGGTLFVAPWAVLAALVPALVQRWLDRARTSSDLRARLGLLIGILFGTTWSGVYGAGVVTTLATYAVPGAVLLTAYACLSNPSLVDHVKSSMRKLKT